jgi:hypothetical protein
MPFCYQYATDSSLTEVAAMLSPDASSGFVSVTFVDLFG